MLRLPSVRNRVAITFLVFVAVLLLYTGMPPARITRHGLTHHFLQAMDGMALHCNDCNHYLRKSTKSRYDFSRSETASLRADLAKATMAID